MAPALLVLAVIDFLNINPAFSPDGRRLVFESHRDGQGEIYVVNVDGSGLKRITSSPGDETHPSWSPDGKEILFDSNRGGTWNLYVMRPDGTRERRLTDPGAAKAEAFARHPSWSPDGKWIAFDSDRDGDEEVYVMKRDGTGLRRLTRSPGRDGHASWTPDGRAIVFGSSRSGAPDVWRVAVRGGNEAALVTGPEMDAGGKVSPDGRRLAYFSGNPPDIHVGTLALEDAASPLKDPANVTRSAATEYEMAWSPDGTQIAFYSDRTGQYEIYVMKADGSGLRQVTETKVP